MKLTSELADQCEPRAWMIYRPLPQGAIRVKDFARYCIGGLSRADLVSVVLLTVLASLIGLLIPTLNQKLYDEFVPQGQLAMVYQIGYLIAAFMIGNVAFSVVKSLSSFRLTSRIESQVQNAVYYRVFELPERFFRRYESADLASRIMEVGGLAEGAAQLVFSLGISLIVSVIYLARMLSYSMVLSVTALLLLVIFSVVDYRISLKKLGYQKKLLELDGKTDSQMFQLIRGIEKIRIAGVEDRAILEYMKSFARQRRLATDLSRISIMSGTISSVFGGALTLTLYGLAYGAAGISMGEFVGFQSAFGTVSGTITGIGGALISYQLLKMSYERIRDMMETESEANEAKRLPEQLTGAVDLDHVVFSYEPYMPPVITDLSLHIRAGEYVGIVGASGCGKSTLLKLLLGFEKTDSGRIYYDNQDMNELDLQELRKRFGVVLQDGELISGSIFENITLTAGRAGQMEVMKVAEAVGLAEDIRAMPMGLQTVVSENCNTISGGQKQRILIARALINRPKIVFFDEATSALDNITQAQVCATLEQMDSTRVVIAHRLSTIKNCDRILVMDRGNIAEEGTYETLMEKRGLFYELASRQIL